MSSPLPIQRLISISVNLETVAPQALNQQGMLVLGNSPVIDTKTRLREYPSLAAVGLDFQTSDPEWQASEAWFGQNPQPTSVTIGRWAQTATSGQLFGAPFSAAAQASLLTTLQAITTGSFDITVDGTSKNLTALDFSAITTLTGAAAFIQTALAGAATCVWNSNYGIFIITSATTGAASSVSFATAGGAGTDISGDLQLLSTDSGAYTVAGIAAESALAAVQLFDTNYGTQWYGLFICGAADTDHTAVATYIESATNYHFYGVNTQEAGVLDPTSTTDIGYLLSQAEYQRTAYQYSSSSNYAVVSLLGRIMTTDYTENNSVINLMWKQEPTILPEYLSLTQINALEAKNGNVFQAYNNNTYIIEPGVTAAGPPYYIDTIMGVDALVIALLTALYNVQYSSPTKIPQTDAGMHQYVTAMDQVGAEFINDGLLAPGVWTGTGFGALANGDQTSGFYVYAPPVASQPASNRAKRISVPFQIAAKLAGAVNTLDVALTVNN